MGTDFKGASARHKLSAEPLDFLTPPQYTPSSFFLGPNAENKDLLKSLLDIALEGHVKARETYAPNDPNMAKIDPDQTEQAQTRRNMMENMSRLSEALQGSIPLASHRNQSHMYWDLALTGTAGYFAGMLYNQNNVAAEASPVTTHLELEVGKQLCEMLGYDLKAKITPWGKLIGGGSLANFEAIWAARNIKYLAAALARAIRVEEALADARKVTVTLPSGKSARLLDLDTWELVNIEMDAALELKRAVSVPESISDELVASMVDRYSLQAMGIAAFHEQILHGAVQSTPAVIVPATAHYSLPKAVSIQGMGLHALERVDVDVNGRMKLDKLEALLNACLDAKRPVLAVTAVMGTTHEGAVDPLDGILEIRKRFADQGLTFALHGDCAWGGYFAAMLRKPKPSDPEIFSGSGKNQGPMPGSDGEKTAYDGEPQEPLNPFTRKQFELLWNFDTITLDPHKSGFIPYPGAAICYRNQDLANEIAYTSPVVSHGGEAPTVGTYGIEGSRPGAVACGVALSHAAIPPNQLGYGRLLSRCIFNSKRFYAAAVSMIKPDDPFIIVPFNRLPAEADGGTEKEIADQKALIAKEIVPPDNKALVGMLDAKGNEKLKALFKRLGPDLTVMSYAFNFKVDGVLNTDVTLFNDFNHALFNAMSLQEKGKAGEVPDVPFFVTEGSFEKAAYGSDVLDSFAARAGLEDHGEAPLNFLISTMQNPFVSEAYQPDGDYQINFINTLIEVLHAQVAKTRIEFIKQHSLGKEGV